MGDFPRWKIWSIWLVILFGVLLSIPSFFPKDQVDKWPSILPHMRINLGLDLAGGSQLLLEADVRDAAKQRLAAKEEEVTTELRRGQPRVEISDVSTRDGHLSFMVRDPTQLDEAVDRMRKLSQPLGLTGGRDWDVQVVDSTRIVLTPSAQGTTLALKDAMIVARDVVRRRIDPNGTKEVTVVNQGARRILVAVPGVENPDALKALIGQTARLEFKLVDLTALPSDIAQGIAPPGSQIVPFADAAKAGGSGGLAVKRLGGIKGDQLVNAQQSYDQNNQAVVSITFDQQGGAKFARLTTENVGKPFAIILDGKVLSAPNINEPILGGNAQISGGFDVPAANQLAISLRSGALPVDLKVVEERTVGPDLGADSVRRGMIALLIGTVALMTFMLVTYGRFGVYTCLALILNTLMILGVMALANTTLTLPGIAGFVLTIGAAVDANVLINERIREERARGRRVVQAVEMGYREARSAIFDGNTTNIIAALLMFMFGSGPIKGFAVVLIIGIATSVFTAVTMTRMWVASWLRRARPTELVL